MKKWGDRRDGTLLRDIDAMHYVMPLIYPNRCDNEAYMTMDVELDKLEAFIDKYNEGKPEEEQYSVFGLIIAAALKTIYKRPQMNRFIVNNSLFQRNEVTASFVVKKSLSDDSEETLARVVASESDTAADIQKKVNDQISYCKEYDDPSTDAMNIIKKLPFKKLIGWLARWADKHDLMPKSVIATDPYQCSVILTNLGSIGLNIGYHHLMNWGTTSIFIVVGKKVTKPVYDKAGNVIGMQRVIKLSFTVDERISDGFYFGKSLRLMKRMLENPEIMLKKTEG